MDASAINLSSGVDQAQQFLEYLAGCPDAVFNFRTISHNGNGAQNLRGTFAQRHAWLAAQNAAGADIFVLVNETNGGTKTDDVVAIRAVFVDFDEIVEGERLADRKKRLDYFNSAAPMSLGVETSPGKHHVYWFTHGFDPERFSSFQKELAAVLGSDPAIHDLPRIMRVPGFVHRKGEPFLSRVCYVAESKERRRKADYSLPATLETALAKTVKKFGLWDAPKAKAIKPKANPRRDKPDLFTPPVAPAPSNPEARS